MIYKAIVTVYNTQNIVFCFTVAHYEILITRLFSFLLYFLSHSSYDTYHIPRWAVVYPSTVHEKLPNLLSPLAIHRSALPRCAKAPNLFFYFQLLIFLLSPCPTS